MLASMILGSVGLTVAWRVGGVRKLLELQLLGSSWWFVFRCLRISGRFMINLKRVSSLQNCPLVVDVLLIDEGLNALPYCLFGVGG